MDWKVELYPEWTEGKAVRKVQCECRPRPTPSARFPAINEDRRNGDRARGRGCILLFRTVKREREKRQGAERPQKLQEATRAIFSTSFPLFKLMSCRLLGVEESKNQIRDQRGESDAKAKRVLMMFQEYLRVFLMLWILAMQKVFCNGHLRFTH